MTRSPDDRRVPALDTLRAFAILIVVIHHMMVASRNLLPVSGAFMRNLIDSGRVGVDLFFVLSGYLIARILLRDLDTHTHLHLGNFLWRRWTRTFPAYFATLLLILAGHLILDRGAGRHGGGASLSEFFPHYFLFTQNYATPLRHFTWSWSLCIEEHFYVALPLLIILSRRLAPKAAGITLLRVIAAGGLAATLALRLSAMAYAGPDFLWIRDIYYRTHTHLDGITTGVFLATLPAPRSSRLGLAGAAAALILLLVLSQIGETTLYHTFGFGLIALAFGWLVRFSAGGNAWSRRSIPGMKFIADISYSLYLLHLIVIGLFDRLWGDAFSPLRSVGAFAACLAAATALRVAVEIPFLRVRDKFNPFSDSAWGGSRGGRVARAP